MSVKIRIIRFVNVIMVGVTRIEEKIMKDILRQFELVLGKIEIYQLDDRVDVKALWRKPRKLNIARN